MCSRCHKPDDFYLTAENREIRYQRGMADYRDRRFFSPVWNDPAYLQGWAYASDNDPDCPSDRGDAETRP